MTLDYTIIALSVVLLWIPRPWMRFGRLGLASRRRSAGRRARENVAGESMSFGVDYRLNMGREFGNLRNWLDLARALTGGFGLLAVGMQGLMDTPLEVARPYIAGQIGIVVVAVLIQMLRFEKRFTFFAPVFFIQGLMFGLVDWRVGLLVMIGTWAINPLLPSPAPFLTVLGCIAAIFGTLVGVPVAYVLTAAGISIGPVLVSILLKRRLAGSLTRKEASSSRRRRSSRATDTAGRRDGSGKLEDA
ncbi:hypothetical protein OPIT5_19845 [Opitutaceae bacterium TAV5]|nr:hypothetical protein OPIT5_19845 [Opitutaceae bacterium TAV5]